VIVDSGVWIDHFTDRAGEAIAILRRALDEGDEIFVLPVIVQEVLQGTRDAAQFKRYAGLLTPLPLARVPDSRRVAVQAADLYARLRWKGVTVPPADCLIAASALATRKPLLTTDADFRPIAGARPRLRLIGA
jgi:predicted nucleic acid-binding protein